MGTIMRGMRLTAAGAVAMLLAACGATGSGPETAALAASPIPAGKARVTIARESSLLYAGAPATITLNGAPRSDRRASFHARRESAAPTRPADIASGGKAIIDVPAGANVLAASAWSYPGEYKVKLDAVAGQSYGLVVTPRSASLGPGALLGPIGGMIDAASNENAGAFEMRVAGTGV